MPSRPREDDEKDSAPSSKKKKMDSKSQYLTVPTSPTPPPVSPSESVVSDDGLRYENWVVHANSAISFKMVSSEADLSMQKHAFRATFTHQIFRDELVRGYKGLSVHI